MYSDDFEQRHPKLAEGFSPLCPHPLFHFYRDDGPKKSRVMRLNSKDDSKLPIPPIVQEEKQKKERVSPEQPRLFYCINLDRREDRWKEFLERKPKWIEVVRFSAIDGQKLDSYELDEIEKKIPTRKGGGKFGNGVIGCFLSHFRLWKQISQDDSLFEEDSVVVFEDDAHFVDLWEEKFRSNLADIRDKDWDLTYVGGRFFKNFSPEAKALEKHFEKITEKVYKFKDLELNPNLHRTTHAYLIKKKGAIRARREVEKMLTETPERFGPIDEFLNDRHTEPLIGFDFVPHLCWSPIDYMTDVQGT